MSTNGVNWIKGNVVSGVSVQVSVSSRGRGRYFILLILLVFVLVLGCLPIIPLTPETRHLKPKNRQVASSQKIGLTAATAI